MSGPSVFDVRNDTGSLSPREAARLATQAAARYYDRVHVFRFEPLKSFDQFIILCLMIAGCLALIYYWRSVLKCCLGDDKLRIDRFQMIYWGFFQCCGCCDGEWTRCISANCCCCNPGLKGRNLKRLAGESLGIYPLTIRVQNVVVGGLPQDRYSWFPRNPDLFLQVIADESSPTLNTEVVAEANTECVQFTSNLTLLVKNNPSDDPVRFIVKRMNLTGSTEVADCSVNPARLVMWARENRKVRIQMGGSSRRSDPLCMPWILLDLSVPPEAKYLRKEVGVFTPIISATADQGFGVDLPKQPGVPGSRDEEEASAGLLCGASSERRSHNVPMKTSTGFFAITDAAVFKESYPLVNDKGNEVFEERDMGAQALLNTRSCINILACWVALLLILFLLIRIFTSGCLEEYNDLEVLRRESKRQNKSFDPENEVFRKAVADICNFPMLNLKIFTHIIHADARERALHNACFPPLSTARCAKIQNTTTPTMLGLPCPAWTCAFDNSLEDHDIAIFTVFLLCIFGICFGKLWENYVLKREVLHPRGRDNPRRLSYSSAALQGLRSPISRLS
mmetsp:Transcript_57555/g.168557  ORF Transcript_57555/g.168557 Transcript_57555/m.168557 type:complete len:565 (+) Transcript_57555:60-1754(+)